MRVVHELDRDEAVRRLRRAHLGVLAFCWDGEVHALPVNIGVDDGHVWFRAGGGTKQAAAAAGTRMAVHVHETVLVDHDGWSVTARGHAEVHGTGPADGLLPQVRPWAEESRDAPWVRIPLDRVDGRHLAPVPHQGRRVPP